ncbi:MULTISPECIES: NUDIX hydrolase [unclassified Arthrobacter]|uniref:NUDIX hydrolase n=1 Tax=unclassified Arthrobacter TaxID=235627 RepID=UPI002DF84FA1|nr:MULTISPECIES: NUDIX domain-containing protein [unclassified Arthrobacter]MEC5190331.1 8-oxo-dGTP pyrophosphatase MutT (NUDIX family) [Arthrobacter sp. MP_M4]MEC5202704.1 8-oxo-dGTP pyrophosphatase MutT (NUDIX family) [Arthrobacter sp. MP_M7]
MATPDFILNLRASIGHGTLWIPGVRAVVFDDAGRVLLGQRADNGRWGLITGILEPGEEPAAGLLREVLEETGVVAVAERLVSVDAVGPTVYPNGDVCHFLTLDFRCRYVAGEARVNDDESLAVGWFLPQEFPELMPGHLESIDRAGQADGAAHFQP